MENDVIIPDYLLDQEGIQEQSEEIVEETPEETPEENPEEGEDLEQTSVDYTSYLETLVSNQETIILNQESLEVKIDDLNNQLTYLSANNNLLLNGFFLALIVFCGFWIVKKIFLSLF